MNMIDIPQPRFEQGQDVWALFQGSAHPLRVVKRFYDADCKGWYYKLSLGAFMFVEEDLSPRQSESNPAGGTIE